MCALRTSRVIKAELEKAKIEMNDHFNNCDFCQDPPTYDDLETGYEHPYSCALYGFLSEDVDTLESELSYFDEVFKEELKERGEDVILTKRKTLKH